MQDLYYNMTPDNPAFIALADDLKTAKADIKAIKDAMVGDELSGRVGIVPWHNRMKEDLYGVDTHGNEIESKKNTLLLRVSDIEDTQKKAKWWFSGIVTLALAIKFGISALIEKLWSK